MFKPLQLAGAARLLALAALMASVAALAVQFKSGADSANVVNAAPPDIAQASSTEAIALARRLQVQLAQQPRDARAWVILARLQFEMDRYSEAAMAYERALALPSSVANDPAVWCEYADALAMTQAGELNGRPRELIDRALEIGPNHPKALEMAGSAEYAQGNYASALRYWRRLLAALEPGSQMHQELAAAVSRTERLALMAPATPRP